MKIKVELNRVSASAGPQLQRQVSVPGSDVAKQAAAAWGAARRRQDSFVTDIFGCDRLLA